MTYTNSTHMIIYPKSLPELAVICGNYCRRLRTFSFSKDVVLTPWERLPSIYRTGITIVNCIEPLQERKGKGMLNTSDNLY